MDARQIEGFQTWDKLIAIGNKLATTLDICMALMAFIFY